VAILELRNVSKVFGGGITAVSEISLSVAEGELLVLLGPSGSGKSTLLRLIAGLDSPSGGEIYLGGRRAGDLSPHDRQIAMVFQNQAPYPHLNVYENLAFGLRARGYLSLEIKTRVIETAELLGLDTLLKRRPSTLSGGQRQRVALGRALAGRPSLLLLDEPFSSLDAPLRTATRADLLELHRRLGTTTVHVTHDQAEALALGDRIAVIDRGRIAQIGPPQEVYERPANRIVGNFLGNPGMNILPVEVDRRDGIILHLVDANDSKPPRVVYLASPPWTLDNPPGGRVDLGIRPEHVRWEGSACSSIDQDMVVKLAVLVRSVQPSGRELRVLSNCGSIELSFYADNSNRLEIGKPIQVAFDLRKAVWFDSKTGRALGTS
jgi:multiple sugar transport system ATP-binding protein